jgi:hypothetical protein
MTKRGSTESDRPAILLIDGDEPDQMTGIFGKPQTRRESLMKTETTRYPDQRGPEGAAILPQYMRPAVAAKYTGHSESTLAKLRMTHNRDKGPRYVKRGGVVLYRRADLDAWLESYFVDNCE